VSERFAATSEHNERVGVALDDDREPERREGSRLEEGATFS